MSIDVVTAAPAAPESPLASLRERKARLVAKLYLDLKVPRWDDDGGPAIFVRYGPAKGGRISGSIEARQKQQKALREDWVMMAQADVLVDSCVGVYASLDGKMADDEGAQTYSLRPNDPNGDWTRFDPDLAVNLGLHLDDDGNERDIRDIRAVDVVRGLYLTDGDLILAYNSLMEWSASAGDRVEEEAQGN